MSRQRMTPEDRREAILNVAQELFMVRGWEAVTVDDVLSETGLSKGGFYHHFSAKEDLLAGIIARMTEQALAAAKAACDQAGSDPLDQLNAFIAGSVRWKADGALAMQVVVDVFMRPGNDILMQRLFDASAFAVHPILSDLIAAGARQGTFDVADPGLAAETIIGLGYWRRGVLIEAVAKAREGDLDAAARRLDARMEAEGRTCDRLLGVPAGSVALSHPVNYRRLLAGISGDAARGADRSV